jgi:hypothetical protein
MPLRIDRVDTDIEIFRKEGGDATSASALSPGSGGGADTLASVRGRAELREKLRPIVMEILNDELMRIKRKVGSP